MDLSKEAVFTCAQEKMKNQKTGLDVPEALPTDEISEIHHLKAVHLLGS